MTVKDNEAGTNIFSNIPIIPFDSAPNFASWAKLWPKDVIKI